MTESKQPSTSSHENGDIEKVEEFPLSRALDDKHIFSKAEKWTIVAIVAFAGLFRQVLLLYLLISRH
jgi:hypothetical protein